MTMENKEETTIERKIGEIFEYNGEWYQCIVGNGCENCAFNGIKCYTIADKDPIGDCCADRRKDNKDVIFKKLEKIGEPFTGKVHIQLQRYKIYTEPKMNSTENVGYIDEGNTIAIEIKQNQEDMEEYRMHDAREDIPEFDKIVDECLFGEDNPSLKPFDLDAAKAGKPVCTRDGRKARIICFDRRIIKPIVALIEFDNHEEAFCYFDNGRYCCDVTSGYDLMMLPEKKEGWVNVCKSDLYNDKEIALYDAKQLKDYIDTVKVEWEE